jgi:hypothetical protein
VPTDSKVPYSVAQNPAPNPLTGQEVQDEKSLLVVDILENFRRVLPSNWVSQTNGPWYTLQFQAMAEQLADIQLTSTEILKDSCWDFTRPDFLWQVLGSFVFPGASDKSGIPQINGDKAYRTFLQKMVEFLLLGATKTSMTGGIEALDPNLVVTILERYLDTPPRNPEGAYQLLDQFTVDIFVETSSGGFPSDPFVTQRNAELVLAALKPAHVLYTYSYLFRDAFDKIADDAGGLTFDLDSYNYDDLRKYCLGVQAISGDSGETLSNRRYFSDPNVSFLNIREGASLRVISGANRGVYRVTNKLYLLSGADPTPRTFSINTSPPTVGTLVALNNRDLYLTPTPNWSLIPLDSKITISSGPNQGVYRLDAVLGNDGGPIATPGISGPRVRVSPSILVVDRRMPESSLGQTYEVGVDRLGIQTPQAVTGEDCSLQFVL